MSTSEFLQNKLLNVILTKPLHTELHCFIRNKQKFHSCRSLRASQLFCEYDVRQLSSQDFTIRYITQDIKQIEINQNQCVNQSDILP